MVHHCKLLVTAVYKADVSSFTVHICVKRDIVMPVAPYPALRFTKAVSAVSGLKALRRRVQKARKSGDTRCLAACETYDYYRAATRLPRRRLKEPQSVQT